MHHTLIEYYEKQKPQDDGNDLADKVKSGAIQVPDFMRGKKLAYNGG